MRSQFITKPERKTDKLYTELLDCINSYNKASAFIQKAWNIYEDKFPTNPSVNGAIFEYLIIETLIYEKIQPIYYQAKFCHIKDCSFDIVLYHSDMPVVFSAKVSLRERYKQASYEGEQLRRVYKKARQYLVTLNKQEAAQNKPKLESGDISGIDDIIVASSHEYDDLLLSLEKEEFVKAEPITPIEGKIF